MTEQTKCLSTEDEDLLYRKIALRVIPLMAVCFIVAYIDRVNISFAKIEMQADLHFSNTVYGIGASIFFLGYATFGIPSNLALSKVGARNWISGIMIAWGIASTLMMWVSTPMQLYAMRFLIGVLESGFVPAVLTYFTFWFPSRRRARANAFFFFAICISGIGGGPLAGWVLAHFAKTGEWAGWQWLFLIEGIPAILLGIFVSLYFDNTPDEARWLSPQEKTQIAFELASDVPAVKDGRSLVFALVNPKLLFVSTIYFLGLLGYVILIFWMPQLIRDSGVGNPQTIGLLSAIPWLASGVAMAILSSTSDRTGDRKWHLVIATFASGAGYILCAGFPTHPALVVTGLSIAMLGYLGCNPILFSLPTIFLSGVALASGIALMNTIGNVASILGPVFIGWITDITKSTHLSITLVGVLVVVNGLITIFFWPFAKDAVGNTRA